MVNCVTDTDTGTTIENELYNYGQLKRIKRTRHPAINRQKGKWGIEEIFEHNLNDPSFYQQL